ncbi:hypothetical protein CVM73_17615 [Bradyrhizobium forestalis]|uniref:Uncharacterized protein n=1 Tax=Bradyrhizobium forestalis TaxID=1419263 RepID=A0A2M8R7R9_9BRAD|nr:hypothetical protein CVM73_17615 [Bradyrhizobium forestalis]
MARTRNPFLHVTRCTIDSGLALRAPRNDGELRANPSPASTAPVPQRRTPPARPCRPSGSRSPR